MCQDIITINILGYIAVYAVESQLKLPRNTSPPSSEIILLGGIVFT
jgi:hypothetical protein